MKKFYNFINYFLLILIIKLINCSSIQENQNFLNYYDEIGIEILDNGDSYYHYQPLEKSVHFFSEKYDHIYINTNGILTFNTEFPEYLNQPFPLEYPSIAPFYSNIDTTDSNPSTPHKIIFYKSENVHKLNKVSDLIRHAFPNNENFQSNIIYVVTWENVGYYNEKNDKLNTFQVVIICNDDETYVQFVYANDGLNWLQAEPGQLGLPDVRAQVGFTAEDGRIHTLNGSGTDNVRYLNTLSNVGMPGVWLFKVGQLNEHENIQEPTNYELKNSHVPRSCSDGLYQKCHSAATCVDTENGFCCECLNGYFGNGFSCINSTIPIRVDGSISGTVNGETIEERAKLQSYVVMDDGRSYTAINPINSKNGQELALVIPIGSAIGWIFAKPNDHNNKNGYQLTGGNLNHLSILTFQTGEIFQINQTFEGLNHWDQLQLKIELSGNLPIIPIGSKLRVDDIIEEFQYIGESIIRSVANQKIEILSPNQQFIEYGIEQIIKFEKCKMNSNDNNRNSNEMIQNKISKINLEYNSEEQALRIVLLTKVGIDDDELLLNPCNDGTANCGYNMLCMPLDGDNYNCVCENGYEHDNDDRNSEILNCIDINECEVNNNVCNENAHCQNIPGGYNCLCYDGFNGNGYDCEPAAAGVTAATTTTEYQQQPPTMTTDHYEPNENDPRHPCDKCSENAICINNICQCRENWIGDGYSCQPNCRSDEIWSGERCVSNLQQEEFIEPYCNDIDDCNCPDSYELLFDENICRIINFDNTKSEELVPCDVDFTCHTKATCEWSENQSSYVCICGPGYQGDGYTCNEIEMSCTTQPEVCADHATCLYNSNIGKSECKCDHGYDGDGYTCNLAPECSNTDNDDNNDNNKCGANSFCDNGVCSCLDGYERDLSDFCVPAGKCGGTYCSDNAMCKWEQEQRIQYCECMEGYIGDGITSCKSIPPPCNIRNTCGLYASCVPSYSDFPTYECVCNVGYYGDGYVCIEEKNCINTPSICHEKATCVQTTTDINCVCNQGFLGNGTFCKEINTYDSGFLVISQGVVIIRVPFDGRNGRPIAVASMAIGLDKDCVEGRIYWGDISAKTITSSKYDGTDRKAFITKDIESPEGIAIDWISRRLYWTDSSKDTIEVASLEDPEKRTVIINRHLVNPRGIAVDPFKQKLYWSDWNRVSPKIEMSNLDGTNREVLLGSKDLILPNSLVVINPRNNWNSNGILPTGELCYADAGTHEIKCLNTDYHNTRTIASNLSYPFGLSMDNDDFYWTDWTTKQIESVNRNGIRKNGIRTQIFGSHKMYGMTAITESCPLLHSVCTVNNGGCTDERLCLANDKQSTFKSCKCTKLSKNCQIETNYDYE